MAEGWENSPWRSSGSPTNSNFKAVSMSIPFPLGTGETEKFILTNESPCQKPSTSGNTCTATLPSICGLYFTCLSQRFW